MDGPVIVGADGSAEAMNAVEWAALEADRWVLPLHIVHALRHAHVGGIQTAEWLPPGPVGDARRIVAQAEERAREVCPGLTVRAGIFDEAPVECLVSASDSAGLVVVGGRGHGATAGLLLGSVSGAVAARAKCPITVVRRHRQDGQAWIVVGLGHSTASPRYWTTPSTRRAGGTAVWRWCMRGSAREMRAPQLTPDSTTRRATPVAVGLSSGWTSRSLRPSGATKASRSVAMRWRGWRAMSSRKPVGRPDCW